MGFPTREEIRNFEDCRVELAKKDAEIASLKCDIEQYHAQATEYQKRCDDAIENLKNCKKALEFAENEIDGLRKERGNIIVECDREHMDNYRKQITIEGILSAIKGGNV